MTRRSLRRIRLCIAIVIFGLIVSGVTAFPLETELRLVARTLSIPPNASPSDLGGFRAWIVTVRDGLIATNARYPFLAYGTDWLAFAHLILAILFIGPYRWRCIDCSFGIIVAVPLGIARSEVNRVINFTRPVG